jgi:hypothetical protein
MVDHFESPPIDDSLAIRSEGLEESSWKEPRFPPDAAAVACYDGTLLLDEINRQCTPAHLRIKQRSTGKFQKKRYLDEIMRQVNSAG